VIRSTPESVPIAGQLSDRVRRRRDLAVNVLRQSLSSVPEALLASSRVRPELAGGDTQFLPGDGLIDLLPAADAVRTIIDVAISTSPLASGFGLALWPTGRWERMLAEVQDGVEVGRPRHWVDFLPISGTALGFLLPDDDDDVERLTFAITAPSALPSPANATRPSLLHILMANNTPIEFAFAARGPCEVDPLNPPNCLRRWCAQICRKGHTFNPLGEPVPACFCDH
jgi:hypothetical protein